MKVRKHVKYMITILLFVALGLFLLILFCIKPSKGKETATVPEYGKYFDESSVMTIDIIIDDAVWEEMLINASKEQYVRCDVILDGERINNVGIRPKGNASLQQVKALGSQRYSFKLEFDHYVKGQTFHGLDKLVLNNTMSDASYMREFMSYEIFEAAKVAVPLHSFAQIKRNGIDCGLYLALEAVEESYASRVYGEDYGQLYKPESENLNGIFGGAGAADELARLEDELEDGTEETGDAQVEDLTDIIDSVNGVSAANASEGVGLSYIDDQVSSYPAIFNSAVFDATQEDFLRVIEAIKNLSNSTDLDKYINIDATLRYFAAQTFLVNFDSYYGSLGHNYYLYEKDGQLTMLPWDLNLAFAGYYSGDTKSAVNYPVDTPLSGVSMYERPMLSKLLEVSEYQKLYHNYLKQLAEDYVGSGKFADKITAMNHLIKSYVENDPTSFYTIEQYEAAVPVLEKFGVLRAESILGQLEGSIPATQEGQKDAASLIDTGNLDIAVLNPLEFNQFQFYSDK